MIYYFLSFLYNSSYVYKHICAKTSLLVRPDMREESSLFRFGKHAKGNETKRKCYATWTEGYELAEIYGRWLNF